MFCLRPGLTSEWPVFKKLCILLYARLASPTSSSPEPPIHLVSGKIVGPGNSDNQMS